MKAKEVKSKFVYPDKLYAITNNNITLDISYAPQTLEAIEYTRTDTIIKKACEFIKERFSSGDSWHTDNEATISDKVIEDFEKYIEE